MPCYHPLHGFINPFMLTKKTHSNVYSFGSIYETKKVITYPQNYDREKYIAFHNPAYPLDIAVVDEFEEKACGHCIGCQLDHAQAWSTRILAEAEYYTGNYFLTLTYADEHLNYAPVIDDSDLEHTFETGEFEIVGEAPTCSLSDVQKFMKRLRKYFAHCHYEIRQRFYFGKYEKNVCVKVIDDYPDITYFACTEYGSWKFTHRPHAHLIILGLKELDSTKLKHYKYNFAGDELYTHPDLDKIWGKGWCVVGLLNEKTAGYVTRYTLKKTYRCDLTVAQRVADYSRYLRDIGLYDQLSKDQRDELLEDKRQEYIYYDLLDHGKYYLLAREQQVMSRAEAIGNKYWRDHWKEIIDSNELWIAGKRRPIPKAFSDWMKVNHPDEYQVWHAMRVKNAQYKYDIWLENFDQSQRKSFLENMERNTLQRIQKLRDRSNLGDVDRK